MAPERREKQHYILCVYECVVSKLFKVCFGFYVACCSKLDCAHSESFCQHWSQMETGIMKKIFFNVTRISKIQQSWFENKYNETIHMVAAKDINLQALGTHYQYCKGLFISQQACSGQHDIKQWTPSHLKTFFY